MVTNDSFIQGKITESFQLINEIRGSVFLASPDLCMRLDQAEIHLKNCSVGFEKREIAKDFLSEIKNVKYAGKPDEAQFHNKIYSYRILRFNYFASYLAACWGIYDNINYSIKRILNIDINSGDEFASILETKGLPLDNDVKVSLLQNYRFSSRFFYQIRNVFLHCSPKVHTGDSGFISDLVGDGLKARKEMFKFFCDLIVSRKYIGSPEVEKSVKNQNVDKVRCLLEVCLEIESRVDQLAGKFLIVSLNQKKVGAGL
jgi:hypothetical protein